MVSEMAEGREQRTVGEDGSNQTGSDAASLRPKLTLIILGAVVLFVLTALLWANRQRDLQPVIADLGWGRVASIVTLTFVLVAAFVYFVAKRTLWDLLDLLIVPLVIAGAGLWFTAQQDARQQQVEEQRAQDAALQAYLDQMSTLVLKDLGNPKVRTLVRARTLTVLQRLENPSRKEEVLRFLQESELVQRVDGKDPVISLVDAKLQRVEFSNATLHGTDLYGATLSHADLLESDLSMANLSRADLSHADLSGTDLSDANLNYTYFLGADLSEAKLSGASGVTKEQLELQAYPTKDATMSSLTSRTVLPALGGISAGEYDSDEFKHALSFKVGKGWKVVWPEIPERLGIETGPEGAELSFHSPGYVFDSSDPGKRKLVPAPETIDKWVSWLQKHPSLDTAKPVPARMRDETGVQIDVSATSMPARCPGGDPCLPLFRSGPGEVRAGKEIRFVIMDIGGEPVVIAVFAPPDKLEEFRTKAEKVLHTVEWKGP
jgi:hypothetical protein